MKNVAIIDSGFQGATYAQSFGTRTPSTRDTLGHGSAISSLICRPEIAIINAKVFDQTLTTTPQILYEALSYVASFDVAIVHMSLGLTVDDPDVRTITQSLLARGVAIVASTPVRSPYRVYPAAYEGVTRVCADGRCHGDMISLIDPDRPLFGASGTIGHPTIGGSSIACARVSRFFVHRLLEGVPSHELSIDLLNRLTKGEA